MKNLRQFLQEYLVLRRSLGFKLHADGVRLSRFVTFMEDKNASYVTTQLALEWAQQSSHARFEPANRLTMVREFAKYLQAFDSRTEVPPSDLMPRRCYRGRPYIYSDEEVGLLLDAVWVRSPEEKPKGTYYCLFGLLATSGLRVGEAIRLDVSDVDLVNGILTIRGTKFGKSRLVPLHPTTVTVLRQYKARREEFLAGRSCAPFFISRVCTRLFHVGIYRVFNAVSVTVGLRKSLSGHGPRLHDFRHRFAVRTLINWYRSGEDVERLVPVLATFLGHVLVSHTYWYLTEYPELMRLAASRLDARWEGWR